MLSLSLSLSLILVLLAGAGSALAQDDALVKKFHSLISVDRINQTPTKYLTVPPGAKLDPRLTGAFYGESTTKVAFLVRVHDDGRVSLFYGWQSPFNNGADNYGGEVAQDGMTIKMVPNVKIWISGDMVKSQWSGGTGSSVLTKMQPVPIALPAAK